MSDLPRIAAVAAVAATTLEITWLDGTSDRVDLARWIRGGSRHIAPLADPAVFARAAVGSHGGNVTWDGDEGDLAIDGEHLRLIADGIAPDLRVDAA